MESSDGAEIDPVPVSRREPEPARAWPKIIIVLVILAIIGGCWYYGKLDKMVPAKISSVSVLGTNAPAYTPPPVDTNAVSTVVSTNIPAASPTP